MFYVGFCPVCGEGALGIRMCGTGQHGVVLCDECESAWRTPNSSQPPIFVDQGEIRCPQCGATVLQPPARWASRDEIDGLEWGNAIVGQGQALGESRERREEDNIVHRRPAVLLLGPTGSGKTPLGQLLENRGLGSRKCVHFDFGENLRQVVARAKPGDTVSAEDIRRLRGVLQTGALLEDKDFPIAERILHSFLDRVVADRGTLIVLNGLPRHTSQARDLEILLDVQTVVQLACSPEIILARIAGNRGGDRTRRTDDDLPAVRRKLEIYARRTAPLIEYYGKRGTNIASFSVTADMNPDRMWSKLMATLGAECHDCK